MFLGKVIKNLNKNTIILSLEALVLIVKNVKIMIFFLPLEVMILMELNILMKQLEMAQK